MGIVKYVFSSNFIFSIWKGTINILCVAVLLSHFIICILDWYNDIYGKLMGINAIYVTFQSCRPEAKIASQG